MNGIVNGIMNRGGCFHNLHKLAKMAILQKTPGPQKGTHLKGVYRAPEVLNKNCSWVPQQAQNVFIFHKTIYDDGNYLSYGYQREANSLRHLSTSESHSGHEDWSPSSKSSRRSPQPRSSSRKEGLQGTKEATLMGLDDMVT